MGGKRSKVIQNTAMLYIMNIAKLIFPLLTLPYLTRILSVESYAVVTYVKAVMTYIQLIIDFGFLLSATKDIVNAGSDGKKIGEITGNVILGKGILSIASFAVLATMTACIDILRQNMLFTFLSFVYVALSIFLLDFLFRGLEKMHVITVRYLITRTITTLLTFIMIKDDGNLLLVPILEIAGNVAAIIWVWLEIRKMGIEVRAGSIKTAIGMLKVSFVYFLSNMASTAFGALNTLMVGIMLSSADVAFWGLAMQLVNAVQALYTPVTNGVYPEMIRHKDLKLVKNILKVFMPLIFIGCLMIYFGSEFILGMVGGPSYADVAPLLRWFIPLLFISFPAMLFGWPVLGAIGKTKKTTLTTVVTAVAQIIGLFVLALINQFTLVNLAILRFATELLMCSLRIGYCCRYRKLFKAEGV